MEAHTGTPGTLQAYRRAHVQNWHPWHIWHPSGLMEAHGHPFRIRHTRAPLQAYKRAHVQNWHPWHIWHPSGHMEAHTGTLAPVRPPDQTHTGTPGTPQGTGGIFAPDPGGRGRGGATTVAAGLA